MGTNKEYDGLTVEKINNNKKKETVLTIDKPKKILRGYNLRTLIPLQLIGKCIALQNLREIGADKIREIKDGKFNVFTFEIEDGTFEIDWEFAIFEATEYQFSSLFDCFNSKPVVKEEETEDAPQKEVSAIITKETLPAGIVKPLIIER